MNRPIVDIDVAPTKQQIRERLEWVKQQITEHPETYDQGDWGRYCRSPCCIAGHLASLAAPQDKNYLGVLATANALIATDGMPWLFGPYWSGSAVEIDEDHFATPAEGCRAIDLYLKEIGA